MTEFEQKSRDPIERSIAYGNATLINSELNNSLSVRARTSSEQYQGILESGTELFESYPIPFFAPDDGAVQKKLFLDGEIQNPNNRYSKLDELDLDEIIFSLEQTRSSVSVLENETRPELKIAYTGVTERYIGIAQLMKAARDFKHATSTEEKTHAREIFMKYNIELYGMPNEETYRQLLAERLKSIDEKQLIGRAAEMREGLRGLLGKSYDTNVRADEAFRPSQETIDWAQEIAHHLHEKSLQYVPEDKESFSAVEIQEIWQAIIDNEFYSGPGTSGWLVVIDNDAKAANVRSVERKVVIPVNTQFTREHMIDITIHEVGVHVLSSVMGEETQTEMLRYGTANFIDAQEGTGAVSEEVFNGKYKQRGVPYYLISGLLYFEGGDFRKTFETWWRFSALDSLKTEDITDEAIQKKRDFCYNQMFRITRGTDELPWFKDLQYYNGSEKIWRYLEENRGDELKFMFLIALGKIDPTNSEDRRLALESRSR